MVGALTSAGVRALSGRVPPGDRIVVPASTSSALKRSSCVRDFISAAWLSIASVSRAAITSYDGNRRYRVQMISA